jgi:hypothetical protein
MSEAHDMNGVVADESPTLGKLAEALAKAQGAIRGATKDTVNGHFKNKYADLASTWAACREPLSANGLAVLQRVSSSGNAVIITTQLIHSSGEWVRDRLAIPVAQQTAQGYGSAITYGRRYALAALVGIAPDDGEDDGNAASLPARAPPKRAEERMTASPGQMETAGAAPTPYVSPDLSGKVRSGKRAGVPIKDLDEKSLTWYARKCAGSGAPEDVAMLRDIETEWARRRAGSSVGNGVAQ